MICSMILRRPDEIISIVPQYESVGSIKQRLYLRLLVAFFQLSRACCCPRRALLFYRSLEACSENVQERASLSHQPPFYHSNDENLRKTWFGCWAMLKVLVDFPSFSLSCEVLAYAERFRILGIHFCAASRSLLYEPFDI